MKPAAFRILVILAALALLGATTSLARELTFEERVQAQEAIERVYYSHQIGATRPFEEGVPRDVLAQKVRTYLKQSVALEQYWHTPITAEMLQAEIERIVHSTRMADRLREVFQSLGNDPFMIQECLARPTLAAHLTRNFFVTDTRIHGDTRAEAEVLRGRILRGELSARETEEHRSVTHNSSNAMGGTDEWLARDPLAMDPRRFGFVGAGRLDDGSADRHRATRVLPGEIGSVQEETDRFRFDVPLNQNDGEAGIAIYSFPKISWDSWWTVHEAEFNDSLALTAASESAMVPTLEISTQDNELSCIQGDTWLNGSLEGGPQPRGGQSMVWTGNLMIIWGGVVAGSDTTNTGAKYDPLTDTWFPISKTSAPVARYGHTAVWTGSEMIVWGGKASSNFGVDLNTGGRYNPETDSWIPTTISSAPFPRVGHTAVWTGNRMIIWGGIANGNAFLGTGGMYDPIADGWVATNLQNPPSGRVGHVAVWTGSIMIVWGGSDWTGFFPVPPPSLATGGRFDPATNRWQSMTLPSIGGRTGAAGVWTGSEMVVWGGSLNGPSLSTGARYDPVQDQWQPMATTNQPGARQNPSVVWTGREVIIWGGYALGGIGVLNDGARYDPSLDQWTSVSSTNAPSARNGNNAVWSGSLMIVWGGTIFSTSGGRYDPDADTWTPTDSQTTPPVTLPGAVWTGDEMLIWAGGSVLSDYPSATGARYDPMLDRWTPMSTVHAPRATMGPTAHWTGREMLVWGGNTLNYGYSPVNTGGKYDPRSDSWSAVSDVGAPPARLEFSSVWTGSRMIIWGGGPYFTSGGGRYDPESNSWAPVSTANAPAFRYNHSAVWTGSEMIVWGGTSGIEFNSGGRYNPDLDVWSPITLAGAPTPRQAHSAVWTGHEMLIWGGMTQRYPSIVTTATGARYNPATNSWAPMSEVNRPSARSEESAVWTGKEMIVWGGRFNNQPTDSGGRYDALSGEWRTISLSGSPEARWDHVALWTGEMMIVWGGPYRRYVATGGRYFPEPVGSQVTVDAGADLEVECAHTDGALVSLLGHGDSCSGTDSLSYTWSGPFPEGEGTATGAAPALTLPLGQSTVTLRVDDGQGHFADDEVVITVRDSTPPSITCPLAPTTECASSEGTLVTVALTIATDTCDASPSLSNSHGSGGADASGIYPLGQTEVGMTARDASGNLASCAFPVNVQDTTPPQIAVALSSSVLWPPNHRMMDVTAPVAVMDACSSPSVVLDSITSSEPDDATGPNDGNTTGDIQGATPGTADFAFQLRAERDGAGGGRFYRVTYSAIDSTGNRSTSSALILVPHDQGGVTEPVILAAREEPMSTTFSWNAVPGADGYQMIRGEMGGLREAGNFIDLGSVSCIYPSANLLAAERTDSQVPPAGRAYFYLVSYRDGMDSGYGTDKVSKPRISTSGGCGATGIPSDPNSIARGSGASATGDRLKTTDSP